MNLGDFITQVCLTVNRIDNDSKAAATSFIANRYKMIYDAYPWRDTEIISDPISLAPKIPIGDGPQLPRGPISFPPNVDRIVKIGLLSTTGVPGVITVTGTGALTDLRPSDAASLMETRPDVLLSTGTPEFYEEINTDAGRQINIYPDYTGTAFQLLVIGKRPCKTLTNASDTPILRNIDNALIAYAVADMLKRDRHYDKAQQQLQEAQAFVQAAIALEEKQSNAPRASRPLDPDGGTLDQLTDFVASRMDMYDARSTIKIQDALRSNYQEIWDRELWTESVVILSIQAQGQQIILPEYVDKVMVVSDQSNNTIDVAELEYIFRTNPSLFDADGAPSVFTVLPPVAVRVLPIAEEPLSFVSEIALDAFNISIVGVGNGQEMTEVVNLTNGTGVSANEYLYPLVISKPQSLGKLTIGGAESLVKFGEIPAEESSVQHQRIWVQPTDSASFNGYYFIVAKRKMQQLVAPTDAVGINGCENTLITMACSDVAKDPAQSKVFSDQAEEMLKTLIARETNQQARRTTVTPWTDRAEWMTDSSFWLRG